MAAVAERFFPPAPISGVLDVTGLRRVPHAPESMAVVLTLRKHQSGSASVRASSVSLGMGETCPDMWWSTPLVAAKLWGRGEIEIPATKDPWLFNVFYIF